MPRAPSKNALLERLLAAVDQSGWRCLVTDKHHPFGLRLFRDERDRLDLRVYIWNCTHGGGAARPTDEYRIQLTGVVPRRQPNERTLLLGWHEGYEVFVAFDLRRHEGQASSSPSIQVARNALLNAHNRAFSAHERGNGETVIAFRPEYLADYALNAESLHGAVGEQADTRAILNEVDTATDAAIAQVRDTQRREIVATIKRRYREHDFSGRVLNAYGHRCAMCGVQLRLIEAAHILPVAADTSTDETSNGVALCVLHHRAYDRNLVSFDENYEIEVSQHMVENLQTNNLAGGLAGFKRQIKAALVLPADRRDYPKPEYVRASRTIRSWLS